jgi:hypothetical protein
MLYQSEDTITYEELFKNKALQDFNLDINDFINETDNCNDILNEVRLSYSIPLSKQDYRRCIQALEKQKNKINVMCDNPQALDGKDQQQIRNINEYLKMNAGRLNGYYSHRKKRTNEVIKEYKKIALANRMFMLVNKDVIFDKIDKIIDIYRAKYNDNRQDYNELRKQNIKDWQKEYYHCVCGEHLQKVSKSRHERTNTHQEYIKSLNPEIKLKPAKYNWHKEKYICICKKQVSKGNKTIHEKTKYHQLYCKPCNETTKPVYECIIDDDDSIENIVLTIGENEMTSNETREKSVANAGNIKNEPDDEAFKYF